MNGDNTRYLELQASYFYGMNEFEEKDEDKKLLDDEEVLIGE